MSRLKRERKTIETMIRMYCKDQHKLEAGLCESCSDLLDYANHRLDKCPYGQTKTTCAKCPIHCYKPEMRNQVKAVMRYAGPKMAYKHPIMAFQHLLDGLKTPKLQKKSKEKN